jgi:hypothetical protein
MSDHNVLVCCYTNHALDQFIEDLLAQGIPEREIVRLGSKPSPATQSMALSIQALGYRFGKSDWDDVNNMKSSLQRRAGSLQHAFWKLIEPLSPWTLLRHLESTHPVYFEALSVPYPDDGMVLIGESGRPIEPIYLLSRWLSGRDPGVLRGDPNTVSARDLWELPPEEREALEAKWSEEILGTQIEAILEAGDIYNDFQAPLSAKFQEGTRQVLHSKRIIACTTTGASIYRDAIHNARPEVFLVEEAGEVQESHVLTALSKSTQRAILIGDHRWIIISLRSCGA